MDWFKSLIDSLAALGPIAYWLILLIATLESVAFVGLLIPATTILIFMGFLAAEGALNFTWLFWFVSAGGIIGDAISFYLGKRGLEKYKLGEKLLASKHLLIGEEFFKKYGEKSVIAARFIGPLRPIIPFVAGLFKMGPGKFFFYNIISGFLAAAFYLTVGYFFGGIWHQISPFIRKIEVLLVITIIAVAMSWFWRKELFSTKG